MQKPSVSPAVSQTPSPPKSPRNPHAAVPGWAAGDGGRWGRAWPAVCAPPHEMSSSSISQELRWAVRRLLLLLVPPFQPLKVPYAVNPPGPSRSLHGSWPCFQVPWPRSVQDLVVPGVFVLPVYGEQQKDPSSLLLIPVFTMSFALPNSLGFLETPVHSLRSAVPFLADNSPWLQNLIRLIGLASF